MVQKIFKKSITVLLLGISLTGVVALAASQSLNNGGATWSGGISDDKVYSKIIDNKVDGLAYKATVWVKNDKGNYNEVTDKTKGMGELYKIYVDIGATHSSFLTPNRAGYKNFEVVKATGN